MKILTDTQREALLKVIAEAPDDMLIDAANGVKQYRLTIQRGFDDLRGYIGMKETQIGSPVAKGVSNMNPNDIVKPLVTPIAAPVPNPDTTMTLPTMEAPKPNVEPEGEAAYKVGGETKNLILGYCSTPKTLDAINTHLKRGKGKLPETAALLKRLWNLGEVFYDGECYITKK